MLNQKISLLALAAVVSFVSCELVDGRTGVTQSAIIGGTAVKDGDWPAVGAITLEPDSMCTGTLISPRVVVTAAHCVKGENPSTFTLGPDMENGTDYAVQTALYYPQYDSGSYNDPGSGDVAVLVLEKAVAGVTPAELFQGDFTQFQGQDITFVGYGKRAVYQSLYGLKYQVTLVIDTVDANGFWNYTSSDDPHNTCGGDSGGPGFILSGGKYYIGAFVSSGDEYCVSDGYNMRADTNAEWLLAQVETYDPGYLNPAECGNGECEYGEDSDSCLKDCPVVEPECGNGECETGETETNCSKDCAPAVDPIWADCATDGNCPDGQFCVQLSETAFYCTIACSDLELGADCGYQDMACHELQDGTGACIKTSISCGDGQCEYGEDADSCAADCDVDCGDLTFEGCCDGTVAVYCDAGQYRTVECGPDMACGWVATDGGYYFCTDEAVVQDPAGVFPMSCDGYAYQKCGDGECTGNETAATCPGDCKATDKCGNGTCDDGETTANCAKDCPVVEPECGNDICDNGETNATCPQDCTTVDPDCGNGTCDSWETLSSCPVDCKVAPDNCGNGTCDNDEDKTTCPDDCDVGGTDCGNDVCEMGEGCRDCPGDCGTCPVGEDIIQGDDVIVAGDVAGEDDLVIGGGGDGCSAGNGGSSPVGLFVMLLFCACSILVARSRRRA